MFSSRVFQALAAPLRGHLRQHTNRIVARQLFPLGEAQRLLHRQTEEMSREVASLRRHGEESAESLQHRASELRAIGDDLASIRSSLDDLARLGRSVQLVLGPQGRITSRLLDPDTVEALSIELRTVCPEAQRDAVSVSVVQAYRLVLGLELLGVGRIAGRVENIVGKLAAVPLMATTPGEFLEIGTLHGLGAAAVCRQLSRRGMDYRATIVDPLGGTQTQGGQNASPDPSGTPVVGSVVEENLRLLGVPPDRFRMIAGLSTDATVRSEISDRRYDVIVVDGDHDAEVVFEDLVFAESVASQGALILLDDYRDPSWPGIDEALTRYLARADAEFQLLGSVATTAILRAR